MAGALACWWCRRKLAAKPGGGVFYALYRPPYAPASVRVHKVCLPAARAFNTSLTAQALDMK